MNVTPTPGGAKAGKYVRGEEKGTEQRKLWGNMGSKFYLPAWLQDSGSEQGVNRKLSSVVFKPGAFLGLTGRGGWGWVEGAE